MNGIYRLGAVLEIDELQAVVVGYDFIEGEKHLKLAYRIIPYPVGFHGDIKLVTADECQLLSDGYDNLMSDQTVKFFETCCMVAENVSKEEMREYLDGIFLGKKENDDE